MREREKGEWVRRGHVKRAWEMGKAKKIIIIINQVYNIIRIISLSRIHLATNTILQDNTSPK